MNNKNSLLLVDPEFDPKVASDCALLIKITTDSYSYAILNRKISQLHVVFDHQECEDVVAELTKRHQTDPYLSLPFQETKIAAYTGNSLFVPQDLYQDDDLDDYKSCFKDEVPVVYTKPVDSYALQIVFAPEPFVGHRIDKLFPSTNKYEHTAPALLLSAGLTGDILFLDFTVSSCNIVFKRDGQLIFSKYFEIEDAGELNYYLVLLLKELAIRPLSTKVYLAGIIHEGDEKYTCITQYFGQIQFLNYFKDAGHDLLDDMPAHYYNSLLAIDLCES